MITKSEREYFHSCYDEAKDWFLDWEFLLFYKKFRKEGQGIKEASWNAVNEWVK